MPSGCKESILRGLNNFKVYSVLDVDLMKTLDLQMMKPWICFIIMVRIHIMRR